MVAAGVAAGAGMGGGGLFVPLLIVGMAFTPSAAIPLSKTAIFGAALANLLLDARKRHPAPGVDRPLIDFDVVLMLEPMTLAGATLGVFLNTILPSWLVLALLVALLSATTKRTWDKATLIVQAESGNTKRSPEENPHAPVATEDDIMDLFPPVVQRELDAERVFPWAKIGKVCVVWASIFILLFAKGGHGATSSAGIAPCSMAYWALFVAVFPLTIGWTWSIGTTLRKEYIYRRKINYPFLPQDITWSYRNTILIPMYSLGAGVAAGLMGIGGGMIKGPLLLELGVDPETATATSGFMILFTSSMTVAQFLLLGQIELDFAAWFALAGFIAALIGKTVLALLIQKYQSKGLIAYLIAAVVGISTILLTYSGGASVYRDYLAGTNMTFSSPCHY